MEINVERALKIRPDLVEFNPEKHELPSYAEVKEDGYGISIVVTETEEVYCIGKKENYAAKLYGHKRVWPLIEELPPNTIIQGELYVAKGKASDVVAALNPKNERYEELNPRLTFAAFAVPYLAGEDYRNESFEEVRHILSMGGFDTPAYVYEREYESLMQEARDLKIEGFVAKERHYAGWYKLKPQKTADFVILKWMEGEGRNEGRLGALMVGAYNDKGEMVEVTKVGGGYTDADRDSITKKDIGRVIEVRYQSVLAKGALQFPQFLRFRDDKDAKDCKTSQTA